MRARGYDAMVGALIVAPVEENCLTGVIFFNTSQNLACVVMQLWVFLSRFTIWAKYQWAIIK